jgi:hypothetical protein
MLIRHHGVMAHNGEAIETDRAGHSATQEHFNASLMIRPSIDGLGKSGNHAGQTCGDARRATHMASRHPSQSLRVIRNANEF